MALLSTAVKIGRRIDLSISTRVKQWRRVPQWSAIKCRSIHSIKDRFSTNTIRYTDVADLLSTPEKDFLVKNNGEKVPVSSLKGKLVGLYFYRYLTEPSHLQVIKEVYEEAKSRGYDFEIVQVTLYNEPPLNAEHLTHPTVQQWLTLSLMDPRYRKIQHLLMEIQGIDGGKRYPFYRLVLIHPCQDGADDGDGVPFESLGGGILSRWGIEGYPFTRQSVYEAEYEVQKREVSLRSLFPPGECLLRRPRSSGNGFDLVDPVSQLSGKRVLVLFAPHSAWHYFKCFNFLSLLKSEYEAQLEDDAAEESKFEVVYVSNDFGSRVSSFDEFTKDMPWLVRPFSSESGWDFMFKVFKPYAWGPAAVAFNEQGELIAKDDRICLKNKEGRIGGKKEGDKFQFPFIDQDLEKRIRREVEVLAHYYNSNY